ncbi:TRAP transporter substrate-binding protein [Virgibacillus ihumii]|uniref:TRAP transporter substrate-binding protein n=1 Tax=Virgibacillus ihumii TaxID=2686091 RepID=UPI00157D93B7|nr:TRAP transporter substrate-binding protein [Virgibacillus ihumii]
MKKIMTLFIVGLLIIVAGCSGDSADGSGGVTLKLAHTGSDTHQYQIASEKFKELVEEKSNGQVTIEIHGNATLGSEGEAVQQVMDGTLDMTTVAAGSAFANTVPSFKVFGIPYLFKDREHVYSVLDGKIGDDLLSKVDEHGMKGLGWWEVGFRHLTNSRGPIKKPEDVDGLKIRVQPTAVWEEHMKALGATPTPIAFNELYSALDQGVVDGQENPLATINSMKFYEVQEYVALTAHAYTPAVVVMGNNAWKKLNEDQQKAVQSAVNETRDYIRQTLKEKDEKIINKLKEKGVTVTRPDRQAFREATKNVKEAVSEQVPSELIKRIKNQE